MKQSRPTIFFLVILFLYGFASIAQPTIEWQISMGGTGFDVGRSIIQTSDGGYIISSQIWGSGGDITGFQGVADYWFVKLSSSGSILWQKAVGGSAEDDCYTIKPTSDGGYIAAGNSDSFDGDVTVNNGDHDVWIVKVDSIGNIQWEKSLGGTLDEEGFSILQTKDGGFIVAGGTASDDGDVSANHGAVDCWLVKLSSTGNIEWEETFGGTANDGVKSIIQTPDEGYIFSGSSRSNDGDVSGNHGLTDVWVVKLSSAITIEWQKSLGGSGEEIGHSIINTTDGGYIVAGQTDSNDGDVSGNKGVIDVWVVKLDSAGNIEWQDNYGGSNDDIAFSIAQTIDGGYVVATLTKSDDGDVTGYYGQRDYWLIRLTSTGSIQWQKTLGGTERDFAGSAIQSSDGGYVFVGYSESNDNDVTGNHGQADVWVVKLAGKKPISNFTSSDSDATIGSTISFTDASLYAPTKWQWTFEQGVPALDSIQNPQILYNDTGTFDVTLVVTNAFGSDTLLRSNYITAIDTAVTTTAVKPRQPNKSHQNEVDIYPNPFTGVTTLEYSLMEKSDVTVEVYTLMGQRVEQIIHNNQPRGKYTYLIDMKEGQSGIYLYRMFTKEGVISGKIVLVR